MASQQTIENFKRNARRHRDFLIVGFVTSFTLCFFFAWLTVWAGHQRGWEAQPASIVLGLISTVAIIGTFVFGYSLYSWFSYYKGASASIDHFEKDPDSFRSSYRAVLGPIRWR